MEAEHLLHLFRSLTRRSLVPPSSHLTQEEPEHDPTVPSCTEMQSRHEEIYAAVTFEACFLFIIVIHAASCPAISVFSRKTEHTQSERSVAHTYGVKESTCYLRRYLMKLTWLFSGDLAGRARPDGDG